MLVFFIHGVATRDVQYADKLTTLIKNEFRERQKPTPYFYSSFWGGLLKETPKIWHGIDDSLNTVSSQNNNLHIEEIFRYKDIREGFIADFFGDALTYFNNEKGIKVRQIIAQQLSEYIEQYTEEDEDLHIIAHSLGSVILWDILFSDRFESEDSAWKIKAMITNKNKSAKLKVVNLKTVTTIGSPIIYFNMMLGITNNKLSEVVKEINLSRWINIIHRSDLVAYPLEFSFQNNPETFLIKDKYLMQDANLAETTAYRLGQIHTASALGATDAHSFYWHDPVTAKMMVNNILGNTNQLEITQSLPSLIIRVLELLNNVSGMTKAHSQDFFKSIHLLNLPDGYVLKTWINLMNVKHIFLADKDEQIIFAGFVGWLDSDNLEKAITKIKDEIINEQIN